MMKFILILCMSVCCSVNAAVVTDGELHFAQVMVVLQGNANRFEFNKSGED